MKNYQIKKIECPNELELILDEIFPKNKNYLNSLHNSDFDCNLVKSSLCQESLLKSQFSVWTLLLNNKYDSIFIGCIAKSEKINKKVYFEYLFINQSKRGLSLVKEAINFAKKNKCEKFYFSLCKENESYEKIKNIFFKKNLKKETEIFCLTL